MVFIIPYSTSFHNPSRPHPGKLIVAEMSAQAVGGAVGHNLVSVIVPCYRVIGSDGSLTGYAGGIERKIRLLDIENGNNSSQE